MSGEESSPDSKASIHPRSAFLMVHLSRPYITSSILYLACFQQLMLLLLHHVPETTLNDQHNGKKFHLIQIAWFIDFLSLVCLGPFLWVTFHECTCSQLVNLCGLDASHSKVDHDNQLDWSFWWFIPERNNYGIWSKLKINPMFLVVVKVSKVTDYWCMDLGDVWIEDPIGWIGYAQPTGCFQLMFLWEKSLFFHMCIYAPPFLQKSSG